MKVYLASRQVSHAVVRSGSREELLREVVRVLVEVGGVAMAFIAWHDPATHRLVPVARFGDEQGYADNVRIFSDEKPEGQGPTATALRTAVPYICNDFLNDPRTLQWRDAARVSGWRASAAFPIIAGGSTRGVLNIYALEPDAFSPDRVELLSQVTLDLAIGLEHLDADERRRQAEEALAASEHRLKLAMGAAAVSTFDMDLMTGRIIWDGPHERIVDFPPGGFPPGGFDGTYTGAESRVHPDDLPKLQHEVEEAREAHRHFSCEFRVVRPDGSEHWIYCRGGFQYDDSGRPYRLSGAVLDFSERKRIEAALGESEERLRQAIRVSQLGIFDHDHASDIIYWSPEQRLIFGFSPDKPVTLPAYYACVHPADRERIVAAVKQAHDPRGDGRYDLEHRILLSDGSIRWARIRSQTFFEGEGDARHPVRTVGAVRDITDDKQAEAEKSKLEEHLMRTQKLESIGRLAGGIAHDFNNLLTVINGYSEMLLGQLRPGDPLQATAEQILKAGERAAGLTRQLLAFSRKQVLQPRMLDLNRVVKDMQPMLERLMGEDVEVTAALDVGSGNVYADQHQLEQVIMNLAVNARDAMPHGGRLMIETAGVKLDESYVRLHPAVHAGRYVMLAMSDTGVGMDEETQQRIFEPFFTTKPPGQGTGLGLAVVQGIVAQSGGHIDISSEPRRGTTLRIYLPARAGAATGAGGPTAVPTLGGRETILVVEDVAEVRNYAAGVLKAYGYRVLEAGSGEEALQICEQERGRIHLLLTDVVMPNVNGRELAGRLEKLRPGIKVLFMSGYTDNALAERGVLYGEVHFIEKPFGAEVLARKVRAVLGPPDAARILIAEDEAGVRGLLRAVLEQGGYEVIEAADGTRALQEMQPGQVDIVIADLSAPEHERLEAIQTLRTKAPGIRVIAISAALGQEFLKTTQLLGVDAVLKKPLNTELLLASVADLLKSKGLGVLS